MTSTPRLPASLRAFALAMAIATGCSSSDDDDSTRDATGSDRDTDGDGVVDAIDNCPYQHNPGQLASAGDDTKRGDACDDEDGDSVVDAQDNCPLMDNAEQRDTDGNGLGDVCEYCEPVALVADLSPGDVGSDPGFLVPLDGALYFTAAEPVAGVELRVLDPANLAAGISLVDDIRPGERWGLPNHLTVFDDRLYLTADDGDGWTRLRVFDPARPDAGAAPVPGYGQQPRPENPGDLTALDGHLYLSASDSEYGRELWVHDPDDPTVAAERVADLNPGSGGSWPTDLVALEGKLYFTALDVMATGGTSDDESWMHERVLWVHDPTDPSGPRPVTGDNGTRAPRDLFAFDGRLFFSALFPDLVRELANHDPTDPGAGITLVDAIAPGPSIPIEFIELDGSLYFRLINEPLEKVELRVLDPEDGISLVLDGKDPSFLSALDGKLYFSARDDLIGSGLWMHDPDGPAGNATLVHDRQSDYPSAYDGKLYFSASDEEHGQELRVHDPACRR